MDPAVMSRFPVTYAVPLLVLIHALPVTVKSPSMAPEGKMNQPLPYNAPPGQVYGAQAAEIHVAIHVDLERPDYRAREAIHVHRGIDVTAAGQGTVSWI
jgi:phytoene dehydrogenase-like protein